LSNRADSFAILRGLYLQARRDWLNFSCCFSFHFFIDSVMFPHPRSFGETARVGFHLSAIAAEPAMQSGNDRCGGKPPSYSQYRRICLNWMADLLINFGAGSLEPSAGCGFPSARTEIQRTQAPSQRSAQCSVAAMHRLGSSHRTCVSLAAVAVLSPSFRMHCSTLPWVRHRGSWPLELRSCAPSFLKTISEDLTDS